VRDSKEGEAALRSCEGLRGHLTAHACPYVAFVLDIARIMGSFTTALVFSTRDAHDVTLSLSAEDLRTRPSAGNASCV